MSILTALLPARAGVAIYTTLDKAAATARALGDTRSRGQVMADTLLARVTGAERADEVAVQVHIVVDETTLAGGPTAGHVVGYGPIPAPITRTLAATAPGRQFVHTRDGHIVALDRRSTRTPGIGRRFTAAQRELMQAAGPALPHPLLRRTHPPLRPHHPVSGRRTHRHRNGQGLCEACNYRKQHPDWHTTVTNTGDNGLPHTTEITTPTGHTYQSTAPPPLGHGAKTSVGPDP